MPVKGEIGDIVLTCGTFEWKMSDFLSLSDEVRDYYYKAFIFADERWGLCLFPNGTSDEFRGWISLHLLRADSGPSETVNLKFGVKGSSGVRKVKETQYEFSDDNNWCGFHDFLSRSELSDRKSILMPNDELTIVWDMRSGALKNDTPPASTDQAVQAVIVDTPPASTDQAVQAVLHEMPLVSSDQAVVVGENCQKSLLSLLESGEDSDVVIKVRGKEFPVHRNILRARSDVFHSMFAHDMVERNSGVVKIEDCDPNLFPDFLIHIYSGRCDHISSENACGLYTAADKYDFPDLKQACSDFMKSHIDVTCFCDILTLALKHGDKDLTECATNFFCDNSLEIVKTTGWQTFLTENPIVGNELFIKAMSNSAKTISNVLNASNK